MKFSTKILFGEEQVRNYMAGIPLTTLEISEFTKEYSFDTQEELNAFNYGMNEAYSWLEYCPIECENIIKTHLQTKSTL